MNPSFYRDCNLVTPSEENDMDGVAEINNPSGGYHYLEGRPDENISDNYPIEGSFTNDGDSFDSINTGLSDESIGINMDGQDYINNHQVDLSDGNNLQMKRDRDLVCDWVTELANNNHTLRKKERVVDYITNNWDLFPADFNATIVRRGRSHTVIRYSFGRREKIVVFLLADLCNWKNGKINEGIATKIMIESGYPSYIERKKRFRQKVENPKRKMRIQSVPLELLGSTEVDDPSDEETSSDNGSIVIPFPNVNNSVDPLDGIPNTGLSDGNSRTFGNKNPVRNMGDQSVTLQNEDSNKQSRNGINDCPDENDLQEDHPSDENNSNNDSNEIQFINGNGINMDRNYLQDDFIEEPFIFGDDFGFPFINDNLYEY